MRTWVVQDEAKSPNVLHHDVLHTTAYSFGFPLCSFLTSFQAYASGGGELDRYVAAHDLTGCVSVKTAWGG